MLSRRYAVREPLPVHRVQGDEVGRVARLGGGRRARHPWDHRDARTGDAGSPVTVGPGAAQHEGTRGGRTAAPALRGRPRHHRAELRRPRTGRVPGSARLRAARHRRPLATPNPGWSPMYHVSPSRRADLPLAAGGLDDDLKKAVRRIAWIRQGFYVVVLLVALAGQVSGAVEALHIQLGWAIPAVAALELGGIVVLANADVRRRLGERALASRLLSAVIAAAAVAFNWVAHANHLMGAFFAGMSALGYLVWLMHTENQRRDRLRAKGNLPPTSPAYEVVAHWLRHPWLTMRAKSLAKAHPGLGLYDSLAAARAEKRWERRHSAISKVLHRKIRSAVDPATADIAIAVYDLDEIAARLTGSADYEGLTALIAADLAPTRLGVDSGMLPPERTALRAEPATPRAAAPEWVARRPIQATVGPLDEPPASGLPPVLPALRRDLEGILPRARQSSAAVARTTGESTVDTERVPAAESTLPLELERSGADRTVPAPARARAPRDPSLRSRVHATLDAQVPAGGNPRGHRAVGVRARAAGGHG